jgi:acetyltransferase-like isoleucine patch superfamily enzyme
LAWILVSPLVIACWIEAQAGGPQCERMFSAARELLAGVPTLGGQYLRRAFYWATCRDVSPGATFNYGSMLAHRDVSIGAGTVVGEGSCVGSATIGREVLLAARVSVLSDRYLHGRPSDRARGNARPGREHPVSIGDGTWIGEGAVVMAKVGARCTVAAGSVVIRDAEDGTTLMGNPARRVNLDT